MQAQRVALGFGEVEIFAKIADTATDVRKVVNEELGLRNDLGIAGRSITARILAAWEAAVDRGTKRKALDAEQSAMGLPKALPQQIHDEMIHGYQQAHGKLQDSRTPGKDFVDAKDAQVEKGSYEAVRLKQVVSKEESTGEVWSDLRVGPTGAIAVTRSSKTEVKPPVTTEEFRARLTMEGIAWEFMRMRHPNTGALKDLSEQDWREHVEYVLGDQVYSRRVAITAAGSVYTPSWNVVMELDYQIRKLAFE